MYRVGSRPENRGAAVEHDTFKVARVGAPDSMFRSYCMGCACRTRADMDLDARSTRSALQFPSVREAVSNYGEKVVEKAPKPNVVEKLAAVEQELKTAKNEIAKLKTELALSEEKWLQAVKEGNETKKMASEMANEMANKLDAAMIAVQVCDSARVEAQKHSEMVTQAAQTARSALKEEAEMMKTEHRKQTEELQAEVAKVEKLVTDLTGSENIAEGLAKLQQLAFDTMQELAGANDLLDSLARELEESRRELHRLMDTGDEMEMIRSTKRTLELANTDYKSLFGEVARLKLKSLTLRGELAEAQEVVKATTAELNEVRLQQSGLVDEHAKETAELASKLSALKEREKLLQEEHSKLKDALMHANTEADELKAALIAEKEKARVEGEQLKSSMENNADKLSSIEQLFIDFKKSLDVKESSANRKITAALSEASAARIREQHMMIRLDALREELDEAKMAANRASRKAETTEAEKLIIESELKRWRKASKLLSDRSTNSKHHRRTALDEEESPESELEQSKSILGTYLSRKKASR
ncbi:protein WEAK CHLOROPLAST MOVEMENT UNDER BLUE LIGHT 1-like [Selaginella moellendorffii]|uniref:protein WEAK CHLOROPLAST MOVEMENT UNDER BLUE LIGHT 1-like n=1 Tax=Selaginella moellendorffii TaxID=88036 RepID=UPI000D1CBE17|nr:protein WEAK CHLOROPLAST MOVEMENT UNDER BLUE LIGHT 1-like [Selaginella moellendorffii]|eukprot:XP_024522597.1 protein WEAK CHLOROPLAST MOVEMENT UNDER BLUE LIGHT 1-like [Selaginella moellendorffii]